MNDSRPTPNAEQQPPRTIDGTRDHLIASWRHFLFVVWRRETTLAAVQRMGASLDDLARDAGHDVALIIVAEETAQAPPAGVRKPIATIMKNAPIACCAVVLEGTGFRVAALRAFATGIGLLARPPYPYRPFPTLEDAAKWLESPDAKRLPLVPADSIAGAMQIARR